MKILNKLPIKIVKLFQIVDAYELYNIFKFYTEKIIQIHISFYLRCSLFKSFAQCSQDNSYEGRAQNDPSTL